MRVLHVIATGQRRGGEIFASDLSAWLASAGVSQMVAVLRASGPPAVNFDAPRQLLGFDNKILPGLRISVSSLRTLRSLIRDWKPDVVQAHGGEPLKYAICATAGERLPVVYRRIGTAPRWITQGFQRWAHGLLVRRAARVVAVAEAVRNETIELFRLAPNKVIAIPNAVDEGRMRARKSGSATRTALGIPVDAQVVLSLGALTWEKDPLAHLEIGRLVLRQQSKAFHIVVGDGPMRLEVERAIEAHELNSRVLLLGARSDVPDLMKASDVLIFPSRSEGMPGVLIEAAMMGLPVVAYAVGGVPEIVQDGSTGFLVPGGDREALGERALRLLSDHQTRHAMGEKARGRSRKLFDIRTVAPRYLELYGDIVSA